MGTSPRAKPIGIWRQRHLRYIKQVHKALYTELLTSGRLNAYLADVNEQAEEQMLPLTRQMAKHEGVTEPFKVENQSGFYDGVNCRIIKHFTTSNAR